MQANYDKDLLNYFTNADYLLGPFKEDIAAPTLRQHLLVIHGVGAVGKSSLLRMFRLHCRSVGVSVALASGDEQKSAVEILTRWANDLKDDHVALRRFTRTYEHYRAIQAKVGTEGQRAHGKMAELAGKTIGEVAEAAVAAAAGALLGSVIPGIGTLVDALGGMGVEAAGDWLRGFLKQPDIDLLLDPTKKLTDDFLADLATVAQKRRIVLMLDTFEQMTVLKDWAGGVAQRVGQVGNLSRGVLLVIAGRVLPNWDRAWSTWWEHADVKELTPMGEGDMRELIRRYYATMRGGEPNPIQVEAIIRFARGLPMAVTTAVQLLVKYANRVEDFQEVKPEVVANLVDRLMEGVPKALVPALEAAAIVRWFDGPVLRAVMAQEDVRAVHEELQRFPFVLERCRLHDAVREIIDENLRVQDSEQHRELHERAARYFEKRLEKVTGQEAERLGLERLYHRIRADEEAGIQLFQEMAEELSRYQLVMGLQILLNDLDTFALNQSSSCHWRDYYHLRLEMLKGERTSLTDSYRSLAKNVGQEKLLAYVLCDFGEILMDRETWRTTNEKGKEVLERALSLLPRLDSKAISAYVHLRGYYIFRGQWNEAVAVLQKQLQLFHEANDKWGITRALRDVAFTYGWMGYWRKALDLHEQVRQRVLSQTGSESLKADMHMRPWYLIGSGRYKDAEIGLHEAIEIYTRIGNTNLIWVARRDLAFSLALQDCFEYGSLTFQKVYSYFEKHGRKGELGTATGFWGMSMAREGDLVHAKRLLLQSWQIKQELEDVLGYQEALNSLGYVSELDALLNGNALSTAEAYYLQAFSHKRYGGHNRWGALTGLVRVKHAQGDYAAIPPLLAEAEQLAQQYEYNDHLASLRLTQGHIACQGQAPSWENGFDAALRYYQHALIYALRYNRFLLDEVLSGRPQGTPFRPIIPFCLKCGEEGRSVLMALRNWWKTGVNDIGKPRPDTISPIPEGIPLIEAERIARECEPGDNSPQKSVVEQIEAALKQ